MLDKTKVGEDIAAIAQDWLAAFERALGAADEAALKALFLPESYWRDVVAFTWDIGTVHGRDAIVAALKAHRRAGATNFALAPGRTPPRKVTRVGTPVIEAIFRFETAVGQGEGVVRLVTGEGGAKVWTLLTALDAIKGHEERVGKTRPTGQSYSRDFRGPNWLDLRKKSVAYEDRDPVVLVVGGGQSGLAIAARLKQLQIDTLIVDRDARVGDNWRNRYHALTLHNQVQVNHMPYIPFPPTWPTYIPKDQLANWFESYVESMELNYWTGTEFLGGSYDEKAKHWTVMLRRADGTTRTMRPHHIVMATGVSGLPIVPEIPTLKNFAGTVIHASQYTDGEDWKGKRAIIVGSGNSGHDIAQDLTSSGASVMMVQRSPTLVVNIEPSAQLAYALYEEGPPTEDCDLLVTAMPFALQRKGHIALAERARQIDTPLLNALEARGFKLDFGDDGSGWQFKYLTRGGGYYFNVGASDMIAEGLIALKQYDDIAQFTRDGVQMRDGTNLTADLVVLATGYQGQEALVEKLFGEAVAQRVGPVWGFGDTEELRNMYVRTPQPGLWFMAGSLAQARINSKYLALQIKGSELGLV